MDIVDFKSLLKKFMKSCIRERSPVQFGDLKCVKPVDPFFGSFRGTPIDRYYIDNFLIEHRELIRGYVLELDDSYYSRKFGSKLKRIDVLHVTSGNPRATIVGDLTKKSTIPESAFDCFICTQTYNFIFDVVKAIEGSYYLLKRGGVLLATVPGISQISGPDMLKWGDYWRFTSMSLMELFSKFFNMEKVKIISYGNVISATALLQGVALEDIPNISLLDKHDPHYQVINAVVAMK